MASIRQRLSDYLAYKGLSRYKFYQATGLSNGFLDKEGAITTDKCEKIFSVYSDLNLEWLITGNGEMIRVELPEGAKISADVANKIAENRSIKEMLNTIINLTSENVLLKKENEFLKNNAVTNDFPYPVSKPYHKIHREPGEDDVKDDLAAAPQ